MAGMNLVDTQHAPEIFYAIRLDYPPYLNFCSK